MAAKEVRVVFLMWMGVGKLSIGVMQKIHYHNITKGFMAHGGSIDPHGQGKDAGIGNEFFGWKPRRYKSNS